MLETMIGPLHGYGVSRY